MKKKLIDIMSVHIFLHINIEDKSITIKVGIAAESIDVAFHDHLIIGDGYHSMADTGWLKKVSGRFLNLLKSEPKREGGGHD